MGGFAGKPPTVALPRDLSVVIKFKRRKKEKLFLDPGFWFNGAGLVAKREQ